MCIGSPPRIVCIFRQNILFYISLSDHLYILICHKQNLGPTIDMGHDIHANKPSLRGCDVNLEKFRLNDTSFSESSMIVLVLKFHTQLF